MKYFNAGVKRQVLLCSLLVLCIGSNAQPTATAACYASFANDTLTVGNAHLRFWYTVKKGQLCLAGYQLDKRKPMMFAALQPDLVFAKQQPDGRDFKFTQHVGKHLPGEADFLEAELSFSVGELNVKRVWRIYANVPAVGSQYFFKGKASGWLQDAVTASGNDLIENAALLNGSGKAALQAIAWPLNVPHWRAKVVKLTDATDHYNNLLEEQDLLPYVRTVYQKGNILLLSNQTNQTGIFILKQSPLQESQQGYAGYDFAIDKKQVAVAGLGLTAADISPDEWRASYSIVLGVTAADQRSQLMALRRYQQNMRALREDRDEMVISNTWGDRSQDSRMNEAFVLKELEACARLAIDHFQLDDGWQQGLSKNSSAKAGKKWNDWQAEDWQPNAIRFPSGFKNIVDRARALHIELGLWFNPNSTNNYALWQRDAKVVTGLYDKFGIRIFKIDGLDLASKTSEENMRKFFDFVTAYTNGKVVFNLDVTAGRRGGYFFFTEYGNIFLENRYTDWSNYYPHYTLRNLWQLAKYVPAERIQIEWLNSWRNADKYPSGDPLAPGNISWDYQMAATFMAQPLAWMEVSQLPQKAFNSAKTLTAYKNVQHDLHSGTILPVGDMPDGYSWTGFQSINEKHGYLLIFRENNQESKRSIKTWLDPGTKLKLIPVIGDVRQRESVVDTDSRIQFQLASKFSFALYRYEVMQR